jgi:hypothetical protein
MNLGYPLLSEDAELLIDPAKTTPRDDSAAKGMKEFRKFTTPQHCFTEQVFEHLMKAEDDGMAAVELKNRKAGVSLKIRFNTDTLPYLVQWKMMGEGDYVLGLEPSNSSGRNRKQLREEHLLPELQPGESVVNKIEVILEEIR